MKRKQIYIAYTGGTIGMQKSAQGYAPVAGFLQQFLQNSPEFHRQEMPLFTIHEYQPLIDSSNMGPENWQQIADDIGKNYDDHDGFVILHGTDTMAYTASALSFIFENLTKPVIITGSQIPLCELRSDGQANLLNALYIAANYPVNEVTLFFNNLLLRGNRSTKVHADGFNAFMSPNFTPLLEAGIHIQFSKQVSNKLPSGPFTVHRMQKQPIAVIMLYPGISAEVIRNALTQPVIAMILLTFGIGNAPQDPEFLSLLQEATARGIIVLNLTQCLTGTVCMDNYATGNTLAKAGVLSGYDMTVEAALAKLNYLFSQDLTIEQIKTLLQQDLRGELTP
ncbi:MAG: asparaginase [Enterovibrio sp.]